MFYAYFTTASVKLISAVTIFCLFSTNRNLLSNVITPFLGENYFCYNVFDSMSQDVIDISSIASELITYSLFFN